MNIEERRILAETIEVLEDVPLDESNSKKFTMGEKTKTRSRWIPQKKHRYFCLEP